MPKHGQAAKWDTLAKELNWDDDILILQCFAAVAVSTIPNKNIRASFLEYYFEEEDTNRTTSCYNNTLVAREIIKATYKFSKKFNIDPLAGLESYNLNYLKEMVRNGR